MAAQEYRTEEWSCAPHNTFFKISVSNYVASFDLASQLSVVEEKGEAFVLLPLFEDLFKVYHNFGLAGIPQLELIPPHPHPLPAGML